MRISDRAHVVLPYHAHATRRPNARAAAPRSARPAAASALPTSIASRAAVYGFADFAQPQRFADAMRAAGAPRTTSRRRCATGNVCGRTSSTASSTCSNVCAPANACCSKARKARCSTSDTARIHIVTSSHTIAGGACTGLGIGPHAIGAVYGVFKAYCTRVGAGPFPSELHDERGERLRRQGGEFGTVTGRPRRCGWFDAVAARYAVALNSLDSAIVTKLDVLDRLDPLGIVTGYRRNGEAVLFRGLGRRARDRGRGDAGLDTNRSTDCRRLADLPANARAYVNRLREILEVPIELVSVGRERSQLAR